MAGSTYECVVHRNSTVADLKQRIHELDAELEPYRQKLVLLPGGDAPHTVLEPDTSTLAAFDIADDGTELMLYIGDAKWRTLADETLSGMYEMRDLEAKYGGAAAVSKLWRVAFESAQAHPQDAECQCILALCYHWPLGGAVQNFAAAVGLYQQAAAQGHARAAVGLAWCYAHGQGAVKSAEQAYKWYAFAADCGLAQAQSFVGACLRNGDGVAKDEAEACRWFERASAQGSAHAKVMLGVCYRDGTGVAVDKDAARTLFQEALALGHEPARAQLAALR